MDGGQACKNGGRDEKEVPATSIAPNALTVANSGNCMLQPTPIMFGIHAQEVGNHPRLRHENTATKTGIKADRTGKFEPRRPDVPTENVAKLDNTRQMESQVPELPSKNVAKLDNTRKMESHVPELPSKNVAKLDNTRQMEPQVPELPSKNVAKLDNTRKLESHVPELPSKNISTLNRSRKFEPKVPEPGVLMRAATSLSRDDVKNLDNRRDHKKRGSGGQQRPESMMEGENIKRLSDPIAHHNPGMMSSVFSFLPRFGSGKKKPAADTRTANVIPGLKRPVKNKQTRATPDNNNKTGTLPQGRSNSFSHNISVPPNNNNNNNNSINKTANTTTKQVIDRTKTKSTASNKSVSRGNTTSSSGQRATRGQSVSRGPAPNSSRKAKNPKKSVRRTKKSPARGESAGQEGTTTDEELLEEVDGGGEKRWIRSHSQRRPRNNGDHQHDPATHSDTDIGKVPSPRLLDGECGSVGGSVSSEQAISGGRVQAWSTSFEKLLEDPAGLHTFAEFLRKEYSHENIYFWTACERYKQLTSAEERRVMAKQIFEKHLNSSGSDPVNVDSQARQVAQEGLHAPGQCIFDLAQKHIFNLMKFDCYPRFLKCDLYHECEQRELRGQTLPCPGDDTLDPDLRISHHDSHIKLKKSKSDADERRRKSLLPWNRKDRSKSKDRGEAEYRRRKKNQRNTSDSSSIRSDISGSRTSLNSSDAPLGRRALSKESLTSGELGSLSGGEGYSRCRVILPDLSNSVVAVHTGDTIQDLLTRLLERRGISYSAFDVYQHKTDKLLDKTDDSSSIGGLEVRLEQRVIFRLDLPNRKTVCVKAKPNKVICDVLKPILLKYGLKLDQMFVHKVGEEKAVNLKCHVKELDGDKLVVQTKEEVKEWGLESGRQKKRGNTLDEITNKVFEDLLKGKAEQNFDELGILDFDARSTRTDSSDKNSSILGSFSRRNSLAPEKECLNKPRKPPARCSLHENLGGRGMPADHAIVSKRRGNTPTTKQENDDLYEGLKRAQRSRLDDQRGTEINCQLPDFLKCDQPQDKENQHAHLADQLLAHLECPFTEGVLPSHQEAEDYFSIAHPEVWGALPSSAPHSANATLLAPELDLDDLDDTLRPDDPLCPVPPLPDTSSSSLHVEAPDFSPPPPLGLTALPLSPPPLPPKPKMGGMRGPPPRPPSRQLHLLNPPFPSTSDDDALHEPPIHITRQSHDKFNISFV